MNRVRTAVSLGFLVSVFDLTARAQVFYSNTQSTEGINLGNAQPLADDINATTARRIGAIDVAYVNDGDLPIDLTFTVYNMSSTSILPLRSEIVGQHTFTGLPGGGPGAVEQRLRLTLPEPIRVIGASNWVALRYENWGGTFMRTPLYGPPELGISIDRVAVDDNADGNFDRFVQGSLSDHYSLYLRLYVPEPGSLLLLLAGAPLLRRR